jgi:hypothetical protein
MKKEEDVIVTDRGSNVFLITFGVLVAVVVLAYVFRGTLLPMADHLLK